MNRPDLLGEIARREERDDEWRFGKSAVRKGQILVILGKTIQNVATFGTFVDEPVEHGARLTRFQVG